MSTAGHRERTCPSVHAARHCLAQIPRPPSTRTAAAGSRDYTFHVKQAFSLAGKLDIAKTIGPGLINSPLTSYEQARAFVDAHYNLQKVQWFNTLEDHWQHAADFLHLPAIHYSDTYDLPGLPLYYFCAMLGALGALFRPGPVQRFHWAFVPTLFGTGFIVALTAAVIPRHRFVLEPFWLLYFFLLLDSLAILGVRLMRRPTLVRDQPVEAPAALPL